LNFVGLSIIILVSAKADAEKEPSIGSASHHAKEKTGDFA
jgi:hypothetical protein